jgi:hypothetical protein
MELTQVSPNTFEDAETKTTFTFLVNDVSLKEAERCAYALQRRVADELLKKHFFGRNHIFPTTGNLSGHPGLPSAPSD